MILALILAAAPVVEEQSVAQLRAMSCTSVIDLSLKRIAANDHKGPNLNAVISLAPNARSEARAIDHGNGPLACIPLLVKDNIGVKGLPTTAGSLALAKNTTESSPAVERLQAAGMVVLGKTNLSEWASIRSFTSTSGWSAMGGLTRNPYALNRTACGSSSGSAVAVAASYVPAALGSETDGSITCPASMNGIVGFKPSTGLISNAFVVPISSSQDVVGPMARSVADATLVFEAMLDTPQKITLSASSLKGTRIVAVREDGVSVSLGALYTRALDALRAAGAEVVLIDDIEPPGVGDAEMTVLQYELKAGLDAYLASTPKEVTTRSLDAVIAFNESHAAEEMKFFDQQLFKSAATKKSLDEQAYKEARKTSFELTTRAIGDALTKNKATALVRITNNVATLADLTFGDAMNGPWSSRAPAIAGAPHLTVPMGLHNGMPVGLSFIGPRGSDAQVLNLGYAYEQATHARVKPSYLKTLPFDH